jgi:DNA-directed RNA polymerase subunit RPC12/RpoP
MNDNHEEYVPELKTYNFAHGELDNQQAHENGENIFRTTGDAVNVARNISGKNPDRQYHYYEDFQHDPDRRDYYRRVRPNQREYEEEYIHDQHAGGSTDKRNEVYDGHWASDKYAHGVTYDNGRSNQLVGNHDQFGSQPAAAVPIPAMALQVSGQLHEYGESGALSKPRCVEEEYTVILHRSSSAEAKSANTKYRCIFCDFTFVGGPQKIRVHLTGKRENGTRLSRCEHCPEDVRRKLEERMKAPKETANENGLYDDDEGDNMPSLQPRNVEEHHMVVLSRSQSSNSKSSNTRYKCIYCRFKFVGGPQKIRVHLTGQQEGGTRMQKCARVPEEVVTLMEHRRKAPKPDLLPTPGGSANVVTSSTSTCTSRAHVDSSANAMPGAPPPPTAQSQQQTLAISPQQQALIIAQQQLALVKQQELHAAQLQIQQRALLMQRQQQLEQQLYAQQQIQHLQQLHQQQMQVQMHQQYMQHSQHGVYPLSTHATAAQLHGGSLLLHSQPHHVLQFGQAVPADFRPSHQQQLLQHAPLAQCPSHPIPPHVLFDRSCASTTSAASSAQSPQSHILSSPHPTSLMYGVHEEATTAACRAKLQRQASPAAVTHRAPHEREQGQAQASTTAPEDAAAASSRRHEAVGEYRQE